jgi:hypothetical protein
MLRFARRLQWFLACTQPIKQKCRHKDTKSLKQRIRALKPDVTPYLTPSAEIIFCKFNNLLRSGTDPTHNNLLRSGTDPLRRHRSPAAPIPLLRSGTDPKILNPKGGNDPIGIFPGKFKSILINVPFTHFKLMV